MIWIIAIALIALLVYFWYITIPIIVLIVIYWNKESIEKKIENNKIESALRNKKLTHIDALNILGTNWKHVIFKNDVDYFNHICEMYKNHELQLKCYSFANADKQKFQNLLMVFNVAYKNLENNVLSKRSYTEKSKSELKNRYNVTLEKIEHVIDNFDEIKKQAYEKFLEEKRLDEQRNQEKKRQREEQRKLQLLAKFDLTEAQAKILFKRNWHKKLGLNSEKLFLEIQDLIIDIRFEPKFRKRIYPFFDKVLRLIDNLYQEQRHLAEEWDYKFEEVFEWHIDIFFKKEFWEEYARFKEKSPKFREYFEEYEADWKDEDYDDGYSKYYDWNSESDSSYDLTKSKAFKVLGLDKSATAKQLKDRFRELILKHHPDRNPNSESEEMTKKIIASYEFIKSKVAHT